MLKYGAKVVFNLCDILVKVGDVINTKDIVNFTWVYIGLLLAFNLHVYPQVIFLSSICLIAGFTHHPHTPTTTTILNKYLIHNNKRG